VTRHPPEGTFRVSELLLKEGNQPQNSQLKLHFTQKPKKYGEFVLLTWSEEGNIAEIKKLDPFLGF
jgi:hypothetical protein